MEVAAHEPGVARDTVLNMHHVIARHQVRVIVFDGRRALLARPARLGARIAKQLGIGQQDEAWAGLVLPVAVTPQAARKLKPLAQHARDERNRARADAVGKIDDQVALAHQLLDALGLARDDHQPFVARHALAPVVHCIQQFAAVARRWIEHLLPVAERFLD